MAAAVDRARGLARDDVDLLLRAVDGFRRGPWRTEHAAVCEEAATALGQRGRVPEAVRLLEEAAAVHVDAGADGHLARVDAALRACGVRRRRHGPARASHGWDALSPTELRVVGLVAHGLSNPQVAAQLYISRRTVETHLAHVFRKLDLTSRGQLAAASATRGLVST